MKYLKLSFVILTISFTSTAQNWSGPVNVSNMENTDYFPDFCIDNDGIIHCVWTHKNSFTWWEIYYSKSLDNGVTWSNPEDISQNSSEGCIRTHIVSNSKNHLFVSYDCDTENLMPNQVLLKTYDGISWSEADTVSEGVPGAFQNRLTVDNNDRVYCFFYQGTNTGYFYYRYLEENLWSNIFKPYEGNDHLLVLDAIADDINNIHCLGKLFFEWTYEAKATYLMYDFTGKHITTLMNEYIVPGQYQIIWDGKDINGNYVFKGIYLVRLRCGKNILTRSVEYY
nr:hypothetical protein [Bacteroidota bacterium]